MADVKKIRLPNGTDLTIKDSRIAGVDNAPTSGSGNIVTSGGVYTALDDKVASATIENIVELTQTEYDALVTKDPSKIYIVTNPSETPEGYVSIASVDVESSTEPGGENVTTLTLTNGQEFEIVTLNGQTGPQGNTGSSIDYPYELVNNLTTDDATKGLSAAQGVVLEGELLQLEATALENSVKTDQVDLSVVESRTGRPASTLKWVVASGNTHKTINVLPGEKFLIYGPSSGENNGSCVFCKTDNYSGATSSTSLDVCTGVTAPTIIPVGGYQVVIAPSDATVLIITANSGGNDALPSKVERLNESLKETVADLESGSYVYEQLTTPAAKGCAMSNAGVWNNKTTRSHLQYMVSGTAVRVTANGNIDAQVRFLSEYVNEPASGDSAPVLGDVILVLAGTTKILPIPSGAKAMYALKSVNTGVDYTPSSVGLVLPMNASALLLNNAAEIANGKAAFGGDVLFTKDTIPAGAKVFYDFDVASSETAITVELIDASGNVLATIGKEEDDWTDSHYVGIVDIPSGFDKAVVNGTVANRLDISRMYASRFLPVKDLEGDYVEISPSLTAGKMVYATNGTLGNSTNQGYTDWLPTNGVKYIDILTPLLGSNYSGVAFYKSPDTNGYISGVAFKAGPYGTEKNRWKRYEVPEGAMWFRFSSYATTFEKYFQPKVRYVMDGYVSHLWDGKDNHALATQVMRGAKVVSEESYKYAFSSRMWIYGGYAYITHDDSTAIDADTPSYHYTKVSALSVVSLLTGEVTHIYPSESVGGVAIDHSNTRIISYSPVLVGDKVAATAQVVYKNAKNPKIVSLISDIDNNSLAERDFTVCRLLYNNGTAHDVEYTGANYRQMIYDMGWGDNKSMTADAYDYNALSYYNGVYYAVACSTPSSGTLPLVILTSTDLVNWTVSAKIGTILCDAAEIAIAIKDGKIYLTYRALASVTSWVVCELDGTVIGTGSFPVTEIRSRPYTFSYMNEIYAAINVDPSVFGRMLNSNDYTHQARTEVALYKFVNDAPVLMRRIANPTGLHYYAFEETPPYTPSGGSAPLYQQGAVYVCFSEDRRHLYGRQFGNVSFADATALFADSDRIRG